MKSNFTHNSILALHYQLFNALSKENKLRSNNIPEQQVILMKNKKYNLSEFDIYKYISGYEFLRETLGMNKFKLTEGITLAKNKYRNILIDLLYFNIPSELINLYPLSIVFGIK
jgi:hypothetical protein